MLNKKEKSKQHLLRKYSLLIFSTIICYGLVYLFFFNAKKIALACGISGTLCLLAPWFYRQFRSIAFSIKYLVFSSIIIVVFTAIYTGGPTSPVLFWVTVVPLIGGFLSRDAGASSVRWLGVSLFSFFVVAAYEQIYGTLISEVQGRDFKFVHYFALLGISLMNVILSRLFHAEISKEHLKLEESQKELMQTQNELFQITSQVAHDIRSPLMAMKVISENLEELPEEKRMLIKTAVHRVSDIASSLTYRNFERKYADRREEKSILQRGVILADCIDQIVAEKRVQFRSNSGLEILAGLDYEAYGVFAFCNERELRRILSNVINNSLEAVLERGSISISLRSIAGFASITVTDNGKGIPPEVLKNLGTRGTTYGKREGSGLGLSHAKAQLESWGGELTVESQLSKGTTVKLAVPTVRQPSWFVKKVALEKVKEVVIIDDEASIHQVWDHRLSEYLKFPSPFTVSHFSSPEEFRQRDFGTSSNESRIYLVDYEFIGSDSKGTELIQELKLQSRSILVTSRYDELSIQNECERLSIRLLPKSLVRLVPITL